MKNINYDELRTDLLNYFLSATSYNSIAYMDVIRVENANKEELINKELVIDYCNLYKKIYLDDTKILKNDVKSLDIFFKLLLNLLWRI